MDKMNHRTKNEDATQASAVDGGIISVFGSNGGNEFDQDNWYKQLLELNDTDERVLTEDTDINKYYRDFSSKVRGIIQSLTHSTMSREYRTKNIIKFSIEQRYLIDREECQEYIQKQAKCPFTHSVDYEYVDKKEVLNDEFEQAIEYVDNKYVPNLKKYMDQHNQECIDIIKQAFEDNNIKLKDFKATASMEDYNGTDYNGNPCSYKNISVKQIIDYIIKGWENPYVLYPYQYEYNVIIDINDNMSTETDTGLYKVSYNPNYEEYTIRDKKTGKVYYATHDSDKAYAELDRLNKGGERGPAWKPHNWWE